MDEPRRDSARLRCLFIAADLPSPPDGGGRIATLRVLQAFGAIADVDLVALADSVGPPDLDDLRAICRSVTVISHPFTFGRHRTRQLLLAFTSAFSLEPYRLKKFRSRALHRAIKELTAEHQYDVVHHDQFGVAPYVNPRYPSTLVTQNIESDIYRLGSENARDPIHAIWSRLESRKLRRAERTILPEFDEIFVLTEPDARMLNRIGLHRVTVLPMPAPGIRSEGPTPAEPTILSLGSMSWFGVEEGLLWFHDKVLPLVRARVPTARWRVVGPNAGRAIRRLAEDPQIEVVGYVDDLDGVIATSRVGIVPLRVAGGIRMKLIDMMSWGLPSVSTTLGARGLAFHDGEGCLVRDDPAGFAEAVATLLTDDGRWRAVADSGRAYVLRAHGSEPTRATLSAGILRAITRHESAGVGGVGG